MTRPGVTLALCTFDQEDLDRLRSLTKHDRDGRMDLLGWIRLFASVAA